MYTAIVLDDEEKGRNSLRKFLEEYCPEIEVVGVAASGEDAYDLVLRERPKILFLDIEIGQPNSEYSTTFDLLPKLPNYGFEVVFVTAYEHYALRAIRSHAIGYVLKPISIADLVECVDGVIERLRSTSATGRLEGLIDQMQTYNPLPTRIWIHSYKDIVPVNIDEIIRFEAQGKYTDIICENRKTLTSSKNLGEFVEILSGKQFIKIHRSHVVNADKIQKYSKVDGGTLITTDGKELPVSKNGKELLFKLL